MTALGPITVTDLRLLVDTDNDGVFIDETPIAGATSLGGDVYQFAAVSSIANNLRFTIATINNTQTPLPVELTSFEARCINNVPIISWTTASETNNHHFTVERSTDAVAFESVGTVAGAGTCSGAHSYSFVDETPPSLFGGQAGQNAYYRLQQTDFNGTVAYHGVRSVTCAQDGDISIYPNPFENSFTIQLSPDIDYPVMIEVLDYTGRMAYAKRAATETNRLEVNMENGLASGIYFVKVSTPSQEINKQLIRLK